MVLTTPNRRQTPPRKRGSRMLYVRGPAAYVQDAGLKAVGQVLRRVVSPGGQRRMLATA